MDSGMTVTITVSGIHAVASTTGVSTEAVGWEPPPPVVGTETFADISEGEAPAPPALPGTEGTGEALTDDEAAVSPPVVAGVDEAAEALDAQAPPPPVSRESDMPGLAVAADVGDDGPAPPPVAEGEAEAYTSLADLDAGPPPVQFEADVAGGDVGGLVPPPVGR